MIFQEARELRRLIFRHTATPERMGETNIAAIINSGVVVSHASTLIAMKSKTSKGTAIMNPSSLTMAHILMAGIGAGFLAECGVVLGGVG